VAPLALAVLQGCADPLWVTDRCTTTIARVSRQESNFEEHSDDLSEEDKDRDEVA
jgi:hypothetical protein